MEETFEQEAESASGDSPSVTRARPRPRAVRALPTDRLKFEVQVMALKALAMESHNGTRPVGSSDLSRRIGVAEATAGLNNNFFTEAGLAVKAGKGKYKPTDAALVFEREASFDQASAAKKNLAGPLSQTWFYKEVKSQIALGDTAENRIINVLGIAAGARGDHRPKLVSLLEWLKLAGLIDVSGGRVRLGEDAEPEADKDSEGNAAESSAATNGDDPDPNPPPQGEKPTAPKVDEDRGPVVLEFSFSCNYTAEDLAELSPEQIKALYEAVGGVQAVQAVLLNGKEKS